jgi:hypothetical protein
MHVTPNDFLSLVIVEQHYIYVALAKKGYSLILTNPRVATVSPDRGYNGAHPCRSTVTVASFEYGVSCFRRYTDQISIASLDDRHLVTFMGGHFRIVRI